MKTQNKIENKGYKVIYNVGYKNGSQCIVSVSAIKGNRQVTGKNITTLYKSI